MNTKERLLNAMQGKEIDRIPWAPFLAYYWESMPLKIQNKGQIWYMQQIGADVLLRGFHTLFRKEYQNCRMTVEESDNRRFVSYETPVGTIREIYSYVKEANTWFLTGHPVQEIEDLKILQYLFEHLKIERDDRQFLEDYTKLGDNGLYLPVIGTDQKTCFQSLVEHWIGTENLVYMLYDEPDEVETCLAVMQERALETVRLSVDSPAEAFIFWEDSSTTNINPQMFEKYTAPEINAWGREIHRAGKLLVHHACGHIKDLLPLMKNTEIDVIESISPPPTGNVTMKEARAILEGSGIGLIGGIEPTELLNDSIEILEGKIRMLLKEMKGTRYILANSDSCPPGVAEEKFRMISEIIKE